MQGKKLYVGNLSYSVTEEQLEELFANYGQVLNVTIIEGRGFGFVEMAAVEDAESAQEALNETQFQGRTLRVNEARAPKRRDYGGGGGRRNSSRRSGGGGNWQERGGRRGGRY
jgi:RNA recognition motif-containing protein